MKEVLPYILSFIVLFLAELSGALRDLRMLKANKWQHALFNSFSSALWCIKIAIIVSAPITIITGALGAFAGVMCSYWLNDKI